MLAAARDADKAQWQAAQAQAWITAALGRTRDLPTLEEFLGEEEGAAPSRSGASAQVVEDHNWRLWQMVIDRQFGGDTVQ